MSKDDAEVLHSWQRSQSTVVSTAFVLGQFLGMTELVEKGLVTPEQFVKRCIEITKEYKEASNG